MEDSPASNVFLLNSRDSSSFSAGAPRTPVERAIQGIWESVLGHTPIEIESNFFNLGGNPDLADQIAEQAREVFLLDVSTSMLFEIPTIAGQAACIEMLRSATKRQNLAIPRASRTQEIPLSYPQRRLWFFDQLEPNSALYNSPASIEMVGLLDIDALTLALNEIIRRQEALRTIFIANQGQPFQVIVPELTLSIPLIDLGYLDKEQQNKEASRLIHEEACLPFNLAVGPLVRAKLIRLSADHHIFLYNLHHIICDGWSAGVFIREMGTLYEAFHNDKPSPLPELHIQYADFTLWQIQRLQGEFLDRHLEYWKSKLDNLPPPLNLPTNHPRQVISSFLGKTHYFVLPARLLQRIKELSQAEGATPFMTLLASFFVLLHRYSDQDDICVGTPIANRNRAEMENLIGLFINMLVIRANLAGNPTFRHFLKQIKDTMLEAYDHQDMPFELLVEKLRPPRQGNRTPFFQAMFILENFNLQPLQMIGMDTQLTEIDTDTAKFDLSLYMFNLADGRMRCKMEYSTDLFAVSTIERICCDFQSLLEEIIVNPDIHIIGLSRDREDMEI